MTAVNLPHALDRLQVPTNPWDWRGRTHAIDSTVHRGTFVSQFHDPTRPNAFTPRPMPAPKPLPANPRRVRGGVKLSQSEGVGDPAAGWASQRWSRLIEDAAEGAALREGLEYAKLGQTKRLTIEPGRLDAVVQGRAPRAYVTRITIPTLDAEQWTKAIGALADSAMYAAKILSGEVPPSIEDLFIPLGFRLLPASAADLGVTCTCTIAGPPGGPPPPLPGGLWCKHACCVAHLFAARLSTDPFLAFLLRGLEREDLTDRLLHRRAASQAGHGTVPVYVQRVTGASEMPPPAFDQNLDHFWEMPQPLDAIEIPIEPPPVSHPLLRRLGPSPFLNAAFPLVGLLASCYERISEDALSEPSPETPAESPDSDPDIDDESPQTPTD